MFFAVHNILRAEVTSVAMLCTIDTATIPISFAINACDALVLFLLLFFAS